jgi:hypothetical protein
MLPLAIGISLDFYLIARVVVDDGIAGTVAGLLFALFMVLWYGLPHVRRLRALADGDD